MAHNNFNNSSQLKFNHKMWLLHVEISFFFSLNCYSYRKIICCIFQSIIIFFMSKVISFTDSLLYQMTQFGFILRTALVFVVIHFGRLLILAFKSPVVVLLKVRVSFFCSLVRKLGLMTWKSFARFETRERLRNQFSQSSPSLGFQIQIRFSGFNLNQVFNPDRKICPSTSVSFLTGYRRLLLLCESI